MRTIKFRLLILFLAVPWVARAQFNYTTNLNGTLNLAQYTGSGGAVIIPDSNGGIPITTIGSDAFYQIYGLTSVMMGTNVTSIAQNAIFQCPNLAAVMIPAGVTNIGAGPFADCLGLNTISLEASNADYVVTNGVLFNKTLTSLIQFPGGVVGSYMIPAGVTNIGEAFIGNSLTALSVNTNNLYYGSTNGVVFDRSLTLLIEYPGGLGGSYTVPRTVTTIESAAFEYSANLAGVTIGTNVTSIGLYAFYDCGSLLAISVNATNADYSSTNGVLFDKAQLNLIQFPSGLAGNYIVPASVTNLVSGAFGDAFGLTSVVIPNSVTSIGAETFYSCYNLASVALSDKLANIGQQAFIDCTSLSEVTIPNSVTNIAQFAFYYCPALTSVTFGSGLLSLGQEAFADCQSLGSVCFSGKPPVDGGSVFYYDVSLGTILYVSTSPGWGDFYDGFTTTPCATCGGVPPQLAIAQAGTNVVLTWSPDFTGYTLQSASSLLPPVSWTSLAGQFIVTNPITGTRQFYRLSQ